MSDPVTNVDVEDVLSSIRRLVSNTEEKLHPAPKPERDENEVSDTPASDALVLTSALRVSDPATEPEAHDVDTSGSGAVLDNLRSALSIQNATEEYEDTDEAEDAEVSSEETPWEVEPAESDEETSSAVVEENFEWSSERAKSDEPKLEDYSDVTFEDISPEETAIEEVVDASEAEETHEEEHVAETLEAFDEPSHEEDASPEETADENVEEVEMAEEASEPEVTEAEIDEQDNIDAPDDIHEPDDIDEPDQIVESDDLAEPDHEDDEPDEHSHDEAAFEDARAEESAEEEDTTTVFSEPGETDEAPVDLADFDEALVDEEMLRDLVAEIVRQELTGALGERITRNVRKLVRREIHRAMLTRDFD